jgi:hypothetical protein
MLSRAMISLCAAVLFVVCVRSPAQTPKASSLASGFGSEPFVIKRLDVVHDVRADGTGTVRRTVSIAMQSEAALREFGVLNVGFASASEHVEFVYVRVRRPDGTVTDTPISGVIEQPTAVTREAPFYSDLKEAQLPVKNLQVGDTLEWQALVVRAHAEVPNQFWGVESFVPEGGVVLEESIELRVPANGKTIVWSNPDLASKPVESAEGERRIYRWETAALRPTTGPAADAEKAAKKTRLLTPAEEIDNEQGKFPSVAWTSFQSWAEVGAWYRSLELARTAPDDEVRAKAVELTAGKTTDEDKVKAVYAYVSSNIRYIGVAFGVGRYQPHAAADVLHNQYGDCKDKVVLLAAMLAAVGIQSDAALIGAGVRFNEAVPSPAAFNHLMTHLRVAGQDVWLDSTEEVAPYRMMYYILRDRQALVVAPEGTAALERTPKDPPFPSFEVWGSKGTLNADGVSDSHIVLSLRGDDELALRAALQQVSPSQYEEFTQSALNSLGYTGTTSHAVLSSPADTAKPFTMEFDYHRVKAGDWDNLKTLAQLAPVGLPIVNEATPPVESIRLGVPRTETSTAELKLPAGWRVELPEAVHQKTAFATYDLSYRFENGTLYSERRIGVLQPKLPASEWKTYKKFQDAASLGLENYIQLVRGGKGNTTGQGSGAGQGDAAASPPADESSATRSAQKLIEHAMLALQQRNDATTAESDLAQAKKLNPKERRLNAAYGYLRIMQGTPREAVEDLNEELAMYPDETSVYAMLAGALMMQNDTAGAEAAERKWLAADPGNLKALTQIAQLELTANRPGVETIEKSLPALTAEDRGDERLQLLLGRAQIKAAMKDKGVATLTALLKRTDDPGLMNDSAYELADANAELSLAEDKERIALQRLEEETASWTLDEAPATLQSKSSLIEAAWDTMGWIDFREHKLPEARQYIEAAYRNRPNAVVRGHLEQVTAALDVQPRLPGIGQQDRTYALGASAVSGVAEYRLLLAHGRIVRFEAASDKRVSAAEPLLSGVSLANLFPSDFNAQLVRRGMLNCLAGKCQLVLEP